MFKSDETETTITSTNAVESTVSTETDARPVPASVGAQRESTKDAGRVRFGAGMMRF